MRFACVFGFEDFGGNNRVGGEVAGLPHLTGGARADFRNKAIGGTNRCSRLQKRHQAFLSKMLNILSRPILNPRICSGNIHVKFARACISTAWPPPQAYPRPGVSSTGVCRGRRTPRISPSKSESG